MINELLINNRVKETNTIKLMGPYRPMNQNMIEFTKIQKDKQFYMINNVK